MARIRTIKPEFWTDSKTGTLSGIATKLFLGLLNHCDDFGVIRFDWWEFKARILPYEDGSAADVIIPRVFDELSAKGLVTIFACPDPRTFDERSTNVPRTFDERSTNVPRTFDDDPDNVGEGSGIDCEHDENPPAELYLHVRNFTKHQRVDRAGEPLLPGWEDGMTPKSYGAQVICGTEVMGRPAGEQRVFLERSSNVRRTFDERSTRTLAGKERKGKEGKGNASCSEASSEPASAVFLKFPVVGQQPSKEWALTEDKVAEYEESYPGVNVRQELRRARQWCIDNPPRRKTPAGISRFLSTWLGKAQDQSHQHQTKAAAEQKDLKRS